MTRWFFQDDFALVLLEDADEQIYLTEELQSTWRKAPRVAQFRVISHWGKSGSPDLLRGHGSIYKYIYIYTCIDCIGKSSGNRGVFTDTFLYWRVLGFHAKIRGSTIDKRGT